MMQHQEGVKQGAAMYYTLGLYEKATPDTILLEQKLCAARAAGFDCLELSIDESDFRLARLAWTAEQKESLRQAMVRAGLPIDTMCLSAHRRYPLGSENEETMERSLEILEQAVKLAKDLGIRLIQLAGYDVYYEPSTPQTRARFTENLKKGVEIAAAAGVMLGFETMECVSPAGTPILDTIGKAMRFVRETDSPWLQIYPDTGNICNACGGDTKAVLADICSGRGHIAAVHLKETAEGVFRDLFPGEGRVDFPVAIAALKAQGVRRFTAECWYRSGDDWKARLKAVHDYYRPLLEA